MTNSAFILKKWENRVPYYALMKLEEEKICALEATWEASRTKGINAALTATFVGGWSAVINEARKQTLKYGGRKALGCITGVICGYFGSAAIIIITKALKVLRCAKVCHSVCSGGLDVAELCAAAPINMVEIAIFGRPVVIEGQGFDMFSKDNDPIEDIENILKK